MELLAKFDSVTRDHLRRASNHSRGTHYLGKTVQNEVISLLGKKVRDTILEKIKLAKYYSIILDCTPDVSKTEQMSLVIRIVSNKNGEYKPKEYFINFLPVESTSGAGLTEVLLNELNRLGLAVGNIRGQGYDNGANMKGVHSGVQRRILNENPKAFFVPCSCHSLNLVVQELFVFFSGSTQRWSVLQNHISSLTIKSVSDTRWESRINAIKPLRYQLGEIYDALVEISLDEQKDADTRNRNMVLNETINIMKNITLFLKDYRLNGFNKMLCSATEIAEDMEVSPAFVVDRSLRIRRKTRLFDYEGRDCVIEDPTKQFED
ncbi:hypothetical protein PPYR_04799 [Photinus pyralis]|uniref:DUF4371 domain-containing protein n=1 Tax=Photinus pyralis TaxID=7054 RepID=A0A5N4AZA2_PHOPY|nr:hypothetical protein PPYR_04799 [Photinus pyralis]